MRLLVLILRSAGARSAGARSIAGKVNWRARFSKDEDEPEPYSPSLLRDASQRRSLWTHGARSRCDAPQHEGACGGEGPITLRRMSAPARRATPGLPDRGARPRPKFP